MRHLDSRGPFGTGMPAQSVRLPYLPYLRYCAG
jgi:hypothetical protein